MPPLLLAARLLLMSPFLVSPSAPSDPGARFRQLSEQFVHDTLALSPSSASQAGYHQHLDPTTGKTLALDALLDDVSPAGVARQRDVLVHWRDRFHAETPLASLDLEDGADWRLIDDQIGLSLLEIDQIRSYQHNPTVYVELLGSALFQPFTDAYAPWDVRLGHIISRLSACPLFLEQARRQLVDADPIFVQVAVEENAGNVDLIERTLAPAVAASSPLKGSFDAAAATAVKALHAFSAWLQQDLAKRPTQRTWRLGPVLYEQKFKLVLETAITPTQLLADAERDLRQTRADMLQLALPLHRSLFPQHGDHAELGAEEREKRVLGEVLDQVSEDRPTREALSETVTGDLTGIRQFILDHRIVSLTSRDNLKVIPTPPFMRGVYSVAGFHGAPPLDPSAEAQFWVTPIDPQTPRDRAESKLREYNHWVLKWLCIHEALPGHYVQAEHANEIQPISRRLIRSLYGNGAYVEGWAEYGAQVMMQQGFAGGDPRYRLSYLKIWLRSIANAILDIRMQTQGMTDEAALAFLTQDAFQTRAEAEGKLQRAKLSSTQLTTYYVGTQEWWRLRRAYEASRGKDFSLIQFHDRALDEGALPVSWLGQLLQARSP